MDMTFTALFIYLFSGYNKWKPTLNIVCCLGMKRKHVSTLIQKSQSSSSSHPYDNSQPSQSLKTFHPRIFSGVISLSSPFLLVHNPPFFNLHFPNHFQPLKVHGGLVSSPFPSLNLEIKSKFLKIYCFRAIHIVDAKRYFFIFFNFISLW